MLINHKLAHEPYNHLAKPYPKALSATATLRIIEEQLELAQCKRKLFDDESNDIGADLKTFLVRLKQMSYADAHDIIQMLHENNGVLPEEANDNEFCEKPKLRRRHSLSE